MIVTRRNEDGDNVEVEHEEADELEEDRIQEYRRTSEPC